MSGESPVPCGRGEGLRGGLLGDRPCHSGRRPSLRARPGSRAVISSRALPGGQSGKPRSSRRSPAARRPASAAPGPGGRPWSSPKCLLLALLPRCQPRSGKPTTPKAGILLNEHRAGLAWSGLPWAQAWGWGWGWGATRGFPKARLYQKLLDPKSWDLSHTCFGQSPAHLSQPTHSGPHPPAS